MNNDTEFQILKEKFKLLENENNELKSENNELKNINSNLDITCIYILKLANDKYYVGKSKSKNWRSRQTK